MERVETMRFSSRFTALFKVAAVALALAMPTALVVSHADARAGGGFSSGSRGMRTWSAPPATSTAPRRLLWASRSAWRPRRRLPRCRPVRPVVRRLPVRRAWRLLLAARPDPADRVCRAARDELVAPPRSGLCRSLELHRKRAAVGRHVRRWLRIRCGI